MFFAGWFVVNILAPLLLPVVGTLPLRLFPLASPFSDVRLIGAVKDGQLCWAAIAMCCSTIYEIWHAVEAHKTVPGWAGIALFAAILVMLPAALVAAGGAVLNTPPLPAASIGQRAWLAHYRAFVGSAAMTAIAAFNYTAVHLSIPQ